MYVLNLQNYLDHISGDFFEIHLVTLTPDHLRQLVAGHH
jgi:hypothetical protein